MALSNFPFACKYFIQQSLSHTMLFVLVSTWHPVFLPKYYWTWTRQYKIFHFFSRVRANFYVHISFLTWCLIIESTQLYPMVPHHHWVIVRRINSAPSGINSTELFSVISSLLLRHCLCLLLIIEGNYNNLLITCFFVWKI